MNYPTVGEIYKLRNYAFQFETEMLITLDPVGRFSRNLVCGIRVTGTISHYVWKP